MCSEPLQGSFVAPIEFVLAILSIIAISLNEELNVVNRIIIPLTIGCVLIYCAFRQKSHFDKYPNSGCSSLLSFIGLGGTSFYSFNAFANNDNNNEQYLQYMSYKWEEAFYRSIPLAFIQLLAFYRISLTVADNFLEGADLYEAQVDWYSMYCPFIGGCISLVNGMNYLVYYFWAVKNVAVSNHTSPLLLFSYLIFLSSDIILRTVMHSLVIAWFVHANDFLSMVTSFLLSVYLHIFLILYYLLFFRDFIGLIYCVYVGVLIAWHHWFKSGSIGKRDASNKSAVDDFLFAGCIMGLACILCSPSIATVLEDMHRFPGLYLMFLMNFGFISVYVISIIFVYFDIAFSNSSDEFLFATVIIAWLLYVVSGLCIFLMLKPCCANTERERPVVVDGQSGAPTMVNGQFSGDGGVVQIGVELQTNRV